MNQFTQATSDFAFSLFKQVSKEGENSFLSPTSITLALAMTFDGAGGKTKQQMQKAMFADFSDYEVHKNLHDLVQIINAPKNEYQLSTANRVYCEKSFAVLQSYFDALSKHYQSECIAADFKVRHEQIRLEINKWVEEMTNNKITNLLPSPDVVSSDTRLILVNAIYFKGEWKKQFDESKTVKKPFHVSKSTKINIDTMHAKHRLFMYAESKTCQVLGIPYRSEKTHMTMYFVLPKKKFGLEKVEKATTRTQFIELITTTAFVGNVEVQLPKFKLEQSFDLVQCLSRLGIVDMFSPKADFSSISAEKDLYVSNVIHKAFIEVNENGAKAAAATAVCMKTAARRFRLAPPPPPKRFIADHPFMFAIVEDKTKSLLFLGHYYH